MEEEMNWSVARNLAEKVAPLVTFEATDPAPYSDRPGYKTYLVRLNDVVIGRVFNIRESNHRKAGRLICGTSYSKKWDYDLKIHFKRSIGLYSRTRKDAVLDLVTDLIQRKSITRERRMWRFYYPAP
jgi:hypothetical protein